MITTTSLKSFETQALSSLKDVALGGAVYAAEDVHSWLLRSARGESVARPNPVRGRESAVKPPRRKKARAVPAGG